MVRGRAAGQGRAGQGVVWGRGGQGRLSCLLRCRLMDWAAEPQEQCEFMRRQAGRKAGIKPPRNSPTQPAPLVSPSPQALPGCTPPPGCPPAPARCSSLSPLASRWWSSPAPAPWGWPCPQRSWSAQVGRRGGAGRGGASGAARAGAGWDKAASSLCRGAGRGGAGEEGRGRARQSRLHRPLRRRSLCMCRRMLHLPFAMLYCTARAAQHIHTASQRSVPNAQGSGSLLPAQRATHSLTKGHPRTTLLPAQAWAPPAACSSRAPRLWSARRRCRRWCLTRPGRSRWAAPLWWPCTAPTQRWAALLPVSVPFAILSQYPLSTSSATTVEPLYSEHQCMLCQAWEMSAL